MRFVSIRFKTDFVAVMAGFLEDRSRLFRFLSVIHFVGTSFFKVMFFRRE